MDAAAVTRLAALLVTLALAAAYRHLRGRRAVVVAYRESDDGIQPPDPGLMDFMPGPEIRALSQFDAIPSVDEGWHCATCNRDFDDFAGWRAHIRVAHLGLWGALSA